MIYCLLISLLFFFSFHLRFLLNFRLPPLIPHLPRLSRLVHTLRETRAHELTAVPYQLSNSLRFLRNFGVPDSIVVELGLDYLALSPAFYTSANHFFSAL